MTSMQKVVPLSEQAPPTDGAMAGNGPYSPINQPDEVIIEENVGEEEVQYFDDDNYRAAYDEEEIGALSFPS